MKEKEYFKVFILDYTPTTGCTIILTDECDIPITRICLDEFTQDKSIVEIVENFVEYGVHIGNTVVRIPRSAASLAETFKRRAWMVVTY